MARLVPLAYRTEYFPAVRAYPWSSAASLVFGSVPGLRQRPWSSAVPDVRPSLVLGSWQCGPGGQTTTRPAALRDRRTRPGRLDTAGRARHPPTRPPSEETPTPTFPFPCLIAVLVSGPPASSDLKSVNLSP